MWPVWGSHVVQMQRMNKIITIGLSWRHSLAIAAAAVAVAAVAAAAAAEAVAAAAAAAAAAAVAAVAAAVVAAVAAVVEAVIGCPFNIDVQPSCLTVLQISEGGQRVPGRAYIKFALDFVSGPTQFPMLPSSGAHVTILYSWEHNDDWALYWQRMIQCEALCVPKRRSILLSAARTGSWELDPRCECWHLCHLLREGFLAGAPLSKDDSGPFHVTFSRPEMESQW